MKLSLFTTQAQKAEYCNRMADAIEQNGLRQAKEMLKEAEAGIGKQAWLEMNNISEANYAEAWEGHLRWLQKDVEYLIKKVRKYRKEVQA